MNLDKGRTPMIAKTLSGLEQALALELTELGASGVKPGYRVVEFSGDRSILYKANLHCRTATRILVPIARIRASNGEELYREISKIKWTELISADQTLAIDSVVSDSGFNNSHFVSLKAKDAIVDQIRSKTGSRPSIDRADPDLRLNIHLKGNQGAIALDSSGEPLHKRGYRDDSGMAPINEVLAAGIIKLTDWDYETPLVDPMCGSGTFLIEAAMMARNIAPGLVRKNYGFMRWNDFDSGLLRRLIDEARAAVRDSLPSEIVGSDINPRQTKIARANAKRAGVVDDIRIEAGALSKRIAPPGGPGVLVVNPPYGERLNVDDIAELYHSLGDLFKKQFQGYNAYILTGNQAAAKAVGLRSSRKIILYNGPIECRLLRYEMYSGSRKAKKMMGPAETDENSGV